MDTINWPKVIGGDKDGTEVPEQFDAEFLSGLSAVEGEEGEPTQQSGEGYSTVHLSVTPDLNVLFVVENNGDHVAAAQQALEQAVRDAVAAAA